MTVKDKKRGRPKNRQGNLSAETIVSCAKSLLRNEGKVPSIRKVASLLNVDAMAIYYYFSSKALLLEAVTVSLMEEIYLPTGAGKWQEELLELCTSYLLLLKDHAGLMETMLSMSVDGPAEVFTERFYKTLAPLNLSDELLQDTLALLVDYLHGFALSMHCNTIDGQLTPDMMKGPLLFYTRALEHESG